jgi:hypothetical protein
MILSDVLGSRVSGPDGDDLGYVIDARFVVSGRPGPLLADARLVGLIVSPRNRGSFRGYERTGADSPWPIATLLEWRHRGSFLVLWDDIGRLDDGRVHLRKGFHRWSPALERPVGP